MLYSNYNDQCKDNNIFVVLGEDMLLGQGCYLIGKNLEEVIWVRVLVLEG